jgi:hypothetical protein
LEVVAEQTRPPATLYVSSVTAPWIYRDLTHSENRLACETNVDSIPAWEEQIEEHQRSIIKLKRARNSLLNVSSLPPEVLGDIFCWAFTPDETSDGFEERSYNFLLVCHYWFEVASGTPELWGFWGDSLQDWARRHLRFPMTPLDLVLGGTRCAGTLDPTLRNALQDRATRDTIRRVHLTAGDSELLRSIISPLTATSEPDGVRPSRLESLILWDESIDTSVDVSDFFAHYRFPTLQRLELVNCTISSWDLITSRTSILTTLELCLSHPSPSPTTAQLLSILGSNPTLQKVRLEGYSVPTDSDGGSSLRIPLHHLKELDLSGVLQDVIGLLRRLDHAENMDLALDLRDAVVGDISQVLRPYLRDYLQQRSKSHNGLGLYVSWGDHEINFHADGGGRLNRSTLEPERMTPFMTIEVYLDQPPPKNLLEKAMLDLIADTPREKIVYLRTYRNPVAMEDVYPKLPNLKTVHFDTIPLSAALPKPKPNPDGDEDTLPSLKRIFFDRLIGGDWSPLTTFLHQRMSSGNPLRVLTISRSSYMCPEVAEDVRSVVREFRIDRLSSYP